MRSISFKSEPTVWVSVVRSLLILAVLFGAELSPEQTAGILLAFEAILSTINRQNVAAMPPSAPPPSSGVSTLMLCLVLALGMQACATTQTVPARTVLAQHQVIVNASGELILGVRQAEADAYKVSYLNAVQHARALDAIVTSMHAQQGYDKAVEAWAGSGAQTPDLVKARAALLAALEDVEKAAPVDSVRVAIRAVRIILGVVP